MNIDPITYLWAYPYGGIAAAIVSSIFLCIPGMLAVWMRRPSAPSSPAPGTIISAARSQGSRSGARGPKPEWDGPKPKAAEPPKEETPGEKKPIWKWKRAPKDHSVRDLKRFFRHEMRRFRSAVGGSKHLYDYPWFLVLGESGAGKTTLLKNSRQYPWSAPLAEKYPGEALCAWWCSDEAIMLDIGGELVLRADGTSNAKGWDALMGLLQRYRYQRPIDGLVLAIPATDLVGPLKLSCDELARKGTLIQAKLHAIERRLGMRVPVYPVVTKCDLVVGFASFCAGLPADRRDEMFGWSNPYTLEAGYSPRWIEEAFNSISSVLYPAQFEMFSELPIGADGDQLFQFPIEFQALSEGLASYLDHLFKPSGDDRNALMVRGIYWVGDARPPEPEIASVPAAASDMAGPDGAPMAGPVPAKEAAEETAAMLPERDLCFVRGLIERKVVAEHTVAVPVADRGFSRNWGKRLVQWGIAVILLLGVLAALLEYPRLKRSEAEIHTVLDTISANMAQARDGRGIDRSDYARFAQNLLDGVYRIDSSRMISVLFPSSWVSPLHGEMRNAMVVAYDSIILKGMRAQLEEKTKNLRRFRTISEPAAGEADLVYAIENTPEFRSLRIFTNELIAIEQHATMFNDLRRSGRLKDVIELIRYLFGRELPPDFLEKSQYYRRMLGYGHSEQFDPEPFRGEILATVDILIERLRQRVFMRNVVLSNIRLINADMAYLVATGGNDFESVRRTGVLRGRILTLKNALLDPATSWISKPNFEPDSALRMLMSDIDGSSYLHPGLTQERLGEKFLSSCEQTFQGLKQDIRNETSTVIGGGVVETEIASGAFVLSPTIDTLQEAIGSLLAQKFMRARQRGSITQKRGRGTRLMWNGENLASAAKLQDAFVLFADDGLFKFPDRLQTPAWNMGRIGLEGTMIELVEMSQRVEPSNGDLEDIQREIGNIQNAAPSLLAILRLFDQHQLRGYGELQRALRAQGEGILDDLTRLRNNSGLYSIPEEKLLAWGKNPVEPAGVALLDAPDDAALQDRLGAWREQVRKLATVGGEPVLDFLDKIGGSYSDRGTEWRKIVGEIHRYDDKVMRNSLSSLEELYLDLNNITEENYREKLVKKGTGDYFLERRESLRSRLYAIFSSIILHRVRSRYDELRQAFNNDLRATLPFADFRDRSVRHSATLDEVRGYFQLLDQFVSRDQEIWRQWGDRDYDPDYRPAYRFLDSMIKVRTFFSQILKNDPDRPTAFTIDVEFRANVPKEVDARNIIDWRLRVGDDVLSIQEAIRQGKPLRTLWRVGDRIQLTLRWAKNSPIVPNAVLLGNGVVQADSQTVVYSFNDKDWALFHLLSVHRAPQEHLAKNVQPQVLEFLVQPMVKVWSKDDVPVNSTSVDEPTRAFIRIGVLAENRKESMQVPVFPTAQAPPLPPYRERR